VVPFSRPVRSGSLELTACGGALTCSCLWVSNSELCVSPKGCGSFWWLAAAAPPFYLASLLFLVGGFGLLGDGSLQNRVVLLQLCFGFFFTLDDLGALVCFRSVEICSVPGCCFAVIMPECLEATFVFVFMFCVVFVSVVGVVFRC